MGHLPSSTGLPRSATRPRPTGVPVARTRTLRGRVLYGSASMTSLTQQILRIPQPVRFVLAGGTVAVLYLAGTLILNALGVTIQLAIPIAYVTSLVAQFSLQRYFVFANHDVFALELHQQLRRYILTAAVQYACTATLTAVLPGALGVDERIIYVVVAILASAITYLFVRAQIFHGGDTPAPL